MMYQRIDNILSRYTLLIQIDQKLTNQEQPLQKIGLNLKNWNNKHQHLRHTNLRNNFYNNGRKHLKKLIQPEDQQQMPSESAAV